MGHTRNLCILLGYALARIDDQEHDIRPLHRSHGADDGVALNILVNLGLSPYARRVNEDILLSVVHHHRIDCVARRSRNVRDNHAVFAEQAVDDGTLTHIRFSDQRYLRALILFFFSLVDRREVCFDGFQEIADAETACGRDRNGIAAGEVIELVDIVLKLCEAIHLIDREHHGLLCAAQHVRDAVVRIRDTGSHIGQKDNHVRGVDGNLCLLAHGDEELISRLRLDTAGINQCEVPVEPAAVRINSVPGDTGNVFDD